VRKFTQSIEQIQASMFKRYVFEQLILRLTEARRYIQVLSGPRQVGKTTLVLQAIKSLDLPHHYASADEPTLQNYAWIETQWNMARLEIKNHKKSAGLLVLDEIQKIPAWSNAVKKLWDEDTRQKINLKVVLLGSAPLLLQQGLTESLAGRFENLNATHWLYPEMHKAFGWSIEKYLYFGGYPGAAMLVEDQSRWARYIMEALIETTISRDILLMTAVNKPALLRRLFYLGCRYSGQILSYQKMAGQLQDVGNTTTLAHYLELLSGAGMLTGIQKFAGQTVRSRASSPKLQVLNTALISAQNHYTFKEARENPEYWGHLTESAVGAHLLNTIEGKNIALYYWREGQYEVDFILQKGKKIIAFEVKSGQNKEKFTGLEAFRKHYQPYRIYVIGEQGVSLKIFFEKPIETWFEE
jgi:predicted AAA+ superfamily ATPase